MNAADVPAFLRNQASLFRDFHGKRLAQLATDRRVVSDATVRVDPNFALAMHLDTDEASAANLRTGAQGHLEGSQSDPQNS